jgi:hypothetical protein
MQGINIEISRQTSIVSFSLQWDWNFDAVFNYQWIWWTVLLSEIFTNGGVFCFSMII